MDRVAPAQLSGIRAVGFDLGNTLVEYKGVPLNWQPLYRVALADSAKACGFRPAEDATRAAEEVLARYNTRLHPREYEVSYREIFDGILRIWGIPMHRLEAAAEAFFAHFQSKAEFFPDAIPALQDLRARGLRCGILTDLAYGMDDRLVSVQLEPICHLLDSVVTSTAVGFRKPSPVGYLRMCHELGCAPHEVVYVGDEPKDVEGAARAGLVPVRLLRDRAKATQEDATPSGIAPSDAHVLMIRSLSELQVRPVEGEFPVVE